MFICLCFYLSIALLLIRWRLSWMLWRWKVWNFARFIAYRKIVHIPQLFPSQPTQSTRCAIWIEKWCRHVKPFNSFFFPLFTFVCVCFSVLLIYFYSLAYHCTQLSPWTYFGNFFFLQNEAGIRLQTKRRNHSKSSIYVYITKFAILTHIHSYINDQMNKPSQKKIK